MTSGKDHRMCGLHRPRAAGQRPRGGRRDGSLLSGPLWAWRRGRHSGTECRLHGHTPPSTSPLCTCAGHPGASHEPSKNTDPTLVAQVSPNAVLPLVFLQPFKNGPGPTPAEPEGQIPPSLGHKAGSWSRTQPLTHCGAGGCTGRQVQGESGDPRLDIEVLGCPPLLWRRQTHVGRKDNQRSHPGPWVLMGGLSFCGGPPLKGEL